MENSTKWESCDMPAHYYGKVIVDGELIVLESFPAMDAFLHYLSGEDADKPSDGDADKEKALYEPVLKRLVSLPTKERKAWAIFLDAVFEHQGVKTDWPALLKAG